MIRLLPSLFALLCAAKAPNIVLLSVDDMNCDSIGVFGSAVPGTTPNIDALAGKSLRFNHAHVHASSCVPSRNIIMTGRYLWNSGVTGFQNIPPSVVKNPTIPEFLKEQGYFVMIRGKESHSTPYSPFPAWDISFGDEKRIEGNSRHPESFYKSTREGIEEAANAGKPFFFSINIYDPHTALYNWNTREATEKLNRQDVDNPPSRIYKPDEMVVPGFLPDTPLVRRELAAYYSSVRRSDDSVGAVIRALKESGVYENSILIFFSDHGMPFPFAKTAMYYHSTRTPLMLRWPGVTKNGAVDDRHVVGTVDLFPTIAEMIGKPAPDGLDGRSLGDLLRGGTQPNREHAVVMYEENVGGNCQPTRAVLSRDFGYIVNLWSDGERKFATATRGMATTREIRRLAETGDTAMQQRLHLFEHRVPEEFFHYAKDPDALHNLIDNPEFSGRIDSYRDELRRFMKSHGDPMREIYEKRDDETAVQTYLAARDAAAKARKAKPEIYKRKYEAKTTQPPDRFAGKSPEERARAEARAKKRQARKAQEAKDK